MAESSGTVRAGKGPDARKSTYDLIRENYETVNYTASTDTLVKAASRLVDELPEGVTPAECIAHWRKRAKEDDAARGVIWPEIPDDIQFESGLAWGLWPNQNILHGVTFVGPGYPISHPGLFPFRMEESPFTPQQWLTFDYRDKWGSEDFESKLAASYSFPPEWQNPADRRKAWDIVAEQAGDAVAVDHAVIDTGIAQARISGRVGPGFSLDGVLRI
jgi:hypothetical protein